MADQRMDDEEAAAALVEKFQPRGAQVLYVAFAFSVIVFAAVIAYIYSGGLEPGWVVERDEAGPGGRFGFGSLLPLLSGVHVAMAAVCWTVAMKFMSVLTRRRRLTRLMARSEAAGMAGMAPTGGFWLIAIVQAAYVVRLALLEGAALFGLVICLLGSVDGSLRARPIFALNGLSAVFLLIFIAGTFPTRERLIAIFTDLLRRAREEA